MIAPFRCLAAGLAALSLSTTASVGADLARFRTESTPAFEQPRAQAPLDGTQYAVVAPTFTGADGNVSFLRLVNRQGASAKTSAKSTTFTITVVGSPSDKVYGTAQIAVPALASPQYPLSDILALANAGALTGGDTAYALYLEDTDTVGYQHVIFNGANGFFEDVTSCGVGSYLNPAGSDVLLLPNVHTSALSGYPSQVFIHNFSANPTTYQVTMIDAKTGTVLGSVSADVAADASYTVPETFFEQSVGWTPTADQAHVNLLFADMGNTAVANALVGQFITNKKLSASVNMSSACALSGALPTATPVNMVIKGTLAVTQVQEASSGGGGNSGGSSTSGGVGDRRSVMTIDFPSSGGAVAGGYIPNNGQPLTLSGTYDAASGTLTMSSGGIDQFAITGTFAKGVYTGTITGANQTFGTVSGLDGTLSSVTAYCGSFQSGGQTKQLALEITPAGAVSGVTSFDHGVTLSGQMSGGAITGQTSENGTFSGTLQGDQITGTYTDGGTSAPFTATFCPFPPPVLPSNGGFPNANLTITTPTMAGGSGTVQTQNSNAAGGSLLGSVETLTAVPASGSTFHGWGGACSGTNPTCTVALNGDTFVIAAFCGAGGANNNSCTGGGYAPPYSFKLAVDSGGATGWHIYTTPTLIDCQETAGCSGATISLNPGVQLVLKATVPPPATFLGWGGACSGTGDCTVTMNGDTTVTAALKAATTATSGCSTATASAGSYTVKLNVSLGGSGGFSVSSTPSGLIASNNCTSASAAFAAGTSITLRATGTSGQPFVSWGGACSGSGDCTITMDGDKQVSALFGTQQSTGSGSGSGTSSCLSTPGGAGTFALHVGVNATGSGDYSVTSTPSGIAASNNCNSVTASFAAGTSVTLTPTGSTNQVFQSWGGACGGIGTCTVVMDADKSVGVSFVHP